MAESKKPLRVLIIFGTPALYGMERGVIEIFDLLRPQIEPHFLISQTTRKLKLPVFHEIQRRAFNHSFLSDSDGWDRPARPKSVRHLYRMLIGLVKGNVDSLRASRRCEVLYLPSLVAANYALLAMVLFRLSGRRVIYHFHDLFLSTSHRLRFFSVLMTDLVHNMQTGKEAVTSSNPYLKRKRNFVIPHPIPTMVVQSNGDSRRGEFASRRNLVFVGQISSHKGVDILLDAFDLLRRKRSDDDLFLHLIGGCDDLQLRERIKANQATESSHLKWWGYQVEVAPFLCAAEVYIHPSPPSRCNESFGISLFEAMLLGVPVVCFPSGALREIVIHEKTGLVCNDEDPKALAEMIERLLDDVDLGRRCALSALERCRKRYSRERVKSSWLKLFSETSS